MQRAPVTSAGPSGRRSGALRAAAASSCRPTRNTASAAARSAQSPQAAAVRARAAPSAAPRAARSGPAADNALPGATSRAAAARQTPARRPPPRAGPSAPKPAPHDFPLDCQGRRARSAPASSPPLPLPAPAPPAGLLAPFPSLQHPVFASLPIGSCPPHKAGREHLKRSILLQRASQRGPGGGGAPQLGSPENFLNSVELLHTILTLSPHVPVHTH